MLEIAVSLLLSFNFSFFISFYFQRSHLIDFFLFFLHPALYVVGNKADLEPQRTVPRGKGEEYAASIGAVYFETSAKADMGLNLFVLLLLFFLS